MHCWQPQGRHHQRRGLQVQLTWLRLAEWTGMPPFGLGVCDFEYVAGSLCQATNWVAGNLTRRLVEGLLSPKHLAMMGSCPTSTSKPPQVLSVLRMCRSQKVLQQRCFSSPISSTALLPQAVDPAQRCMLLGYADGCVRLVGRCSDGWEVLAAARPHKVCAQACLRACSFCFVPERWNRAWLMH